MENAAQQNSSKNYLETRGVIFDIQRFSIHDGPGIRTTVFLKGCPWSCIWCHNPEGIQIRTELAFYSNRCIACGRCTTACANGASLPGEERVDRKKCQVCGACAKVCPSGALKMIGRQATVGEVLGEVMRDLPFYGISGGGVTLSGGEPLYQYNYSLCLLRAFKERGLHTAVDTCGIISDKSLAEIVKFIDLFLYDLKVMHPEKHRRFCGADNTEVLENALFLCKHGAQVIFRAPLIPGCNDAPEDIRRLGEFILSLPGGQHLEVIPYHRVGIGKYRALGLQNRLQKAKSVGDLRVPICTLSDMGVKLIGNKGSIYRKEES